MNHTPTNGRLSPIAVPWRPIGAGTSLSLFHVEGTWTCSAELNVQYGPRRNRDRGIVRIDYGVAIASQLVHVLDEANPLKGYDLDQSGLEWQSPATDPWEWMRRVDDIWQSTDVCPSARVYSVLASSWMAFLGVSEESHHHYLLAGSESVLQVVAKTFAWREIDDFSR
jgi:hypothetical protein